MSALTLFDLFICFTNSLLHSFNVYDLFDHWASTGDATVDSPVLEKMTLFCILQFASIIHFQLHFVYNLICKEINSFTVYDLLEIDNVIGHLSSPLIKIIR